LFCFFLRWTSMRFCEKKETFMMSSEHIWTHVSGWEPKAKVPPRCLKFKAYTLSFFLFFFCSLAHCCYLLKVKKFNKKFLKFWFHFGWNVTIYLFLVSLGRKCHQFLFLFFGGLCWFERTNKTWRKSHSKKSLAWALSRTKCEWKCAEMIKRWWVSSLWVLKKKPQNVNEMCGIHSFIHSLSGNKESLVFSTPKCEWNVWNSFIHSFIKWRQGVACF
jgi:hypothetical protein